jgi:glycosyltransferase involved in cell wall biosynthesis
MYNILVYPNITFQKDLEKDSYVVVLCNIIRELNKIRKDLDFTILSPKVIESLKFPNTRQCIMPLPSYPNQMRLHFDSKLILDHIDWKNKTYDLVFSHLPEHTLLLKNLFYNETNEQPVFFGYTHWTEFKQVTNYPMTVVNHNILGLLEMYRCGINTQAQKDLVIQHAKDYFNDKIVDRVNNILQPMYLGAEEPPKITKQPYDKEKKIIVFNHRAHTYKGYDWFLNQMDKVYEKRQDFKVWIPLAEGKDREYVDNSKYGREKYFEQLSKCYMGVCCKQKYAGWSVSATDGLSVGTPYLFLDESYYRELAGDCGIYYKKENEFVDLVNSILDKEDLRNEYSIKSLARFDELKWNKRIIPFNNLINECITKLPLLTKRTDSYLKMLSYVKAQPDINKKELLKKMGWGINITWDGYKNMLRKDGYEIVNNQTTLF